MSRPVPKQREASSMKLIGLRKHVTKILEINYFNENVTECRSNHKGNVDDKIEKPT